MRMLLMPRPRRAHNRLEIRKTRQRGKLASVQTHYNMEGRDLVESATIDHYKKNPAFAQEKAKEQREGIESRLFRVEGQIAQSSREAAVKATG